MSKQSLLPEIGDKPGDIIEGELRITLYDLAEKHPAHSPLILAVTKMLEHCSKIIYCMHNKVENGLFDRPQNLMLGRTIPDIKAQALLEEQKAKERKEENLENMTTYKDLVNPELGKKEVD